MDEVKEDDERTAEEETGEIVMHQAGIRTELGTSKYQTSYFLD